MILHSESFENAAYSLRNTAETIQRAVDRMEASSYRITRAAEMFQISIDKLVKAMGMQAENQYRANCGKQVAYVEEAFNTL